METDNTIRVNSLSSFFDIEEAKSKLINPTPLKQFARNPLNKSNTAELAKLQARLRWTKAIYSYGDISDVETKIEEEATNATTQCLPASPIKTKVLEISKPIIDQHHAFDSNCTLSLVAQIGMLDENVISDFEIIRTMCLFEQAPCDNVRFIHTGKPILCLDLDETLIHSVPSCYTKEYLGKDYGKGIELKNYYVLLRPFIKGFLEEMIKIYDLRVFTSAEEQYAQDILRVIDPQRSIFTKVYSRSLCKVINGKYVKDLNILGADLRKVILVDNSVLSFCKNINNGIFIKPFKGSSCDNELYSYVSFLKELAAEDDIMKKIEELFNFRNLLRFYVSSYTN